MLVRGSRQRAGCRSRRVQHRSPQLCAYSARVVAATAHATNGVASEMSEQEEADWKRRQEEAASVGDDDNNFGGYDNSGRVHSRRAQQPLLLIAVTPRC